MSEPFEVIGEVTVSVPPEQRPRMTVQIGHIPIGEWDDSDENPLQAVARLNREAIEERAERQRVVDQLDAARGTIEQRDGMLRDAQRETARVNGQLESFKDRVRDKAIEVAERMDWCDNGLNEVLDELGLPLKLRRFEVELRVVARRFVTVVVEAPDSDGVEDAIDAEQVENALEADVGGEWTIDDWHIGDTHVARED